MKRKILSLLIFAAFAITSIHAQDADNILDKYFKNIGQDKLLRVNVVTMVGKMAQGGVEMPFKTISKRPGKAYLESDFQGTRMIMAYDGQRAWMVAPFTGSSDPIDLTGPDMNQIKDMGDIDTPLWDWKEKGHQLEYLGTEDMEGTEVHVLKLTKGDGNSISFYIDAENFVVLKTRTTTFVNGSAMEIDTYMSNYQEVNGIIQPFTLESRIGGQTMSSITIDEFIYDETVDDAIFSKPE